MAKKENTKKVTSKKGTKKAVKPSTVNNVVEVKEDNLSNDVLEEKKEIVAEEVDAVVAEGHEEVNETVEEGHLENLSAAIDENVKVNQEQQNIKSEPKKVSLKKKISNWFGYFWNGQEIDY